MSRNGHEPGIDRASLRVHPSPTSDEAAVIVAVLEALNRKISVVPEQIPSAWRLAARREALRQYLPVDAGGWALAARLDR